jgi:radical SAM protein with 4Fe4S-binding SPASM domain
MTQPEASMDSRVFNKIMFELNKMNYKGRISLYLMNEPFLDDKILDLIKMAASSCKEARINISTNGVIPNKTHIAKAYEFGLTDCDVSCYSDAMWNKWKDENVNAIDMRGYKYDYNNRGGNIEAGEGKEIGGYCERPFQQMYINAFGKAVLCCSDYKFQVIMGDIRKQKLKDIWNGEMYTKYREQLKTGERKGLTLCENCNYP